eukprot:TRINITY_DN1729_c0_g1_i1.p1 TRINITY_DN1729_c0_g1~~TRINITY_DN1729_c0_g1_i1.p1  ORF type:complete len:475 (-),score=105.90 TRINITY_DN1729_c0_g1_i1:19-1443(-)
MEGEEGGARWHGLDGRSGWRMPRMVLRDETRNRKGMPVSGVSSEWMDEEEVLEEKVGMLAGWLMESVCCVVYAGAGLSRASGIPDYATHSPQSLSTTGPPLDSSYDAQPTTAHRIITALEQKGYIKYFVQQNHDGLPQKAGFPQSKVNEIHGGWFDPSNPVVQFKGALRKDLISMVLKVTDMADLVLSVGTSLSGMTSDILVKVPAEKALASPRTAIGSVIINLQATALDSSTSLRIWAPLDDVFQRIAKKLELGMPVMPSFPEEDVFVVPYNAKGRKDDHSLMQLNLTTGSAVMVPIQKAANYGAKGKVIGKKHGHYYINLIENGFSINRLLGRWWITAAMSGSVPILPIINDPPIIETTEPKIQEGQTRPHIKVLQSHTTLQVNGETKHKWTLSINPSAVEYIKEVTWRLHNSYDQALVNLSTPPFSIKRTSQDTSTVHITILLKNSQTLKLTHKLSFLYDGEIVKVTEVTI